MFFFFLSKQEGFDLELAKQDGTTILLQDVLLFAGNKRQRFPTIQSACTINNLSPYCCCIFSLISLCNSVSAWEDTERVHGLN